MSGPITIPKPVAYDGPRTKRDHRGPTVLGLRRFMARHARRWEQWPLADHLTLAATLEPLVDTPTPGWSLVGHLTITASPIRWRSYRLDLTITEALDAAAFLTLLRSHVAIAHAADLAHLDAAITAPNPARSVTP